MQNILQIFLLVLFTCLVEASVPSDWQVRIAQGNMLFSQQEPSGKNSELNSHVANGYLGYLIRSETIFVAGMYGQATFPQSLAFHSYRARIAAPMVLTSSWQNSSIIGAAIDLERAIFLRRSTYDSVLIEERYLAHQTRASVLIRQTVLQNTDTKDVTVPIVQHVAAPSIDLDVQPVTSIEGTQAWTGVVKKPEYGCKNTTKMAMLATTVPESILVRANSTLIVNWFVIVRSSLDSSDPLHDALLDYSSVNNARINAVFDEHLNAWSDKWQSSIEIEGDLKLATQINSSLYYILSSVREDSNWSIPPGGLPCNCYQGNIFWDTDLWINPPLIHLYPTLSLVETKYRFMLRDKAREYAKQHGYNGTMFPWQSAQCGDYVDLIHIINRMEIHVTADIAIGLQMIWQSTHNVTWLNGIGYPLLKGIADYWSSRAKFDSKLQQYVISEMVGPDEFALGFPILLGTDNNAFTNAAVQQVLYFATRAAMIVGDVPNPQWNKVASAIRIPYDDQHKVHLEYDGFPKANTYYKGKVKQADAIMLGFPLQYNISTEQWARDLAYYEPLMFEHGPAMTFAIHSIAYLQFGQIGIANEALVNCTKNIQPPFNLWSETPDPFYHPDDLGCFNFLTGAGGFLQAILNGYGGLRLSDDALVIRKMHLPYKATKILLRSVWYQQYALTISYDGEMIMVEPRVPTNELQLILQDGSRVLLTKAVRIANQVVKIARL